MLRKKTEFNLICIFFERVQGIKYSCRLIKIKRQNSITKNLRKKDSKIPMCLLNPRKCIKKKKTEFNLLYIFSERVQGIKQSQNR